MSNIVKGRDGMNIVGQGWKIILFTLPSLIAAALPEAIGFVRPIGYVLLVPGLILWGTAVIQLLRGFSRGELVTTGAYGVARNPIYASATFFILPGISLIALTWVYIVVSIFLYAGVMIFIGTEERRLAKVFGAAYEEYTARVDRLIPFRKP